MRRLGMPVSDTTILAGLRKHARARSESSAVAAVHVAGVDDCVAEHFGVRFWIACFQWLGVMLKHGLGHLTGSASLSVLVGLIGRLADKRACEETWIGLLGRACGFLESSGMAIAG